MPEFARHDTLNDGLTAMSRMRVLEGVLRLGAMCVAGGLALACSRAEGRVSVDTGDVPRTRPRVESGLVLVTEDRRLGARFDERGVEFAGRDTTRYGRFETVRFGCAGSMHDVEATAPERVTAEHRIRYGHHAGRSTFAESWEVKNGGLEQTFDVSSSPCERGQTDLVVELAVEGLTPANDDQALPAGVIELRDATGAPRMRYGDLHVYDADNREVSARLEVSGKLLAIRATVSGARFPIVIDPVVLALEGKFFDVLADGGAPRTMSFGNHVAISGDTALVSIGAPERVYVYERQGAAWSRQIELKPPAGNSCCQIFGQDVAVDRDTALVGMANPDYYTAMGDRTFDTGNVYVFERSSQGWTDAAKLVAANVVGAFGATVSISGDTVLVGAPTAEVNGNAVQGVAYVFTRMGSLWAQQAQLVADDGGPADIFGASVSIDGDTALVGAPHGSYKMSNGMIEGRGAAYVFQRSGTNWVQQAKFVSSRATSRGFATSVSVRGDTLVIGEPEAQYTDGGTRLGSATVYVRSGARWTKQADLGEDAGELFYGMSVAVFGGWAAIGSPQGLNGNGAVHLYRRSGATWTRETTQGFTGAYYNASFFGYAIALDGCSMVVGAPYEFFAPAPTNTRAPEGAIYFYRIPGAPCSIPSDGGIADAHVPADSSDSAPPPNRGTKDASSAVDASAPNRNTPLRPVRVDASPPEGGASLSSPPPVQDDSGGCQIGEGIGKTRSATWLVIGMIAALRFRRARTQR